MKCENKMPQRYYFNDTLRWRICLIKNHQSISMKDKKKTLANKMKLLCNCWLLCVLRCYSVFNILAMFVRSIFFSSYVIYTCKHILSVHQQFPSNWTWTYLYVQMSSHISPSFADWMDHTTKKNEWMKQCWLHLIEL